MLVAGHSHAGAPAPAWAGIWRGTIGDLPVQACLQHRDLYDFGAYFYMKRLVLIGLNPADKDAKAGATLAWAENPDVPADKTSSTARWSGVVADSTSLTASWSDGHKTLPIRMTRVAQVDADLNPCGDLAFIRPRATTPVILTKAATFEGTAYTIVTADLGKHFTEYSQSSFRLNDATPAIARVNAALMKTIPTKAEGAEYLDCAMGALGQNGNDGDYSDDTKPALITAHWLVSQRDVGGYCGGAHPDSASDWTLWDLRSGRKVDLWKWLTPKGATQKREDGYDDTTLSPALARLLKRAWQRTDPDCSNLDPFGWEPHLTRKGIAFMPGLAHVDKGCEDDVVLPYAAVAPFLNAAGKAGIASVTADLKAPRSGR